MCVHLRGVLDGVREFVAFDELINPNHVAHVRVVAKRRSDEPTGNVDVVTFHIANVCGS